MSHSFTVVPKGNFWDISKRILRAAELDRAIRIVPQGPDTALFFCDAPRVASESQDGQGLACVRLLTGSYVIHVDLEGYEGSVSHLERWYARSRPIFSPCTVYDDETGLDLTWDIERLPRKVFGPSPEFVTPK